MQPARSLHTTVCSLYIVVCRLRAPVSGADSIGLQCVIVGVDAVMHSVAALHAGCIPCIRPYARCIRR